MARNQTNTVEYFPHVAKDGKTLFILEGQFGNDGYAVWFKLLSILALSEGHFYDASSEPNWQYLVAKFRCNEITVTEILTLLSKLGNIDTEMWEQHKIIWCQAFVDNISDVYKKRKRPVPNKPKINNCDRNSDNCDRNAQLHDDSVPEIPQSKVKESKVNKPTNPKPKKVKTFIPDDFAISQQVREWARKEGYEPYLEAHLSYFIDYARAGGVQTIDWDAKFRNAIRGDWGEIREKAQRKGNNGSPSKPKKCTNHADRAATWINFYGQDLCDECHAKVVQIRQKSMQREATA